MLGVVLIAAAIKHKLIIEKLQLILKLRRSQQKEKVTGNSQSDNGNSRAEEIPAVNNSDSEQAPRQAADLEKQRTDEQER